VTTTFLSFVDVVVIIDLKQFEFDHVIVALTQVQYDLANLFNYMFPRLYLFPYFCRCI